VGRDSVCGRLERTTNFFREWDMKIWMRWVMVCGLVSLVGGAQAQTIGVDAKDAKEINAALDGMQAAWNHHDMKAFVGYMTDDVEWVNVVGMWWRGKAQVFKAHEAFHKTIFKDRDLHNADTTELRQMAPGVVVVTQIVPADGYTSPSGTVVPPNKNILTTVFVRHGDKWLVSEGHNTVIDERAAAHDPGK
jgi:uncharacterized protein (TIGR02246 family)